jgi:hypothetical protein
MHFVLQPGLSGSQDCRVILGCSGFSSKEPTLNPNPFLNTQP